MRRGTGLPISGTEVSVIQVDRPTVPAPAPDRNSGIRFRSQERDIDPPSAPEPSMRREELESRLLEALKAHDSGAALLLASALAYMDPTSETARRIKLRCVSRVQGRATRELPQLQAVPKRLVDWASLEDRKLTRQQIYVLSLVDGIATVENVIDASAISPLVAYDALDCLLRDKIIGVG